MLEEALTFEEFKARCLALSGAPVLLREVGKHGWTDVDAALDGSVNGLPGPHWCDAKAPRSQRLIGTYDFNAGVARFFSPKTSAIH